MGMKVERIAPGISVRGEIPRGARVKSGSSGPIFGSAALNISFTPGAGGLRLTPVAAQFATSDI